MLALCALGLRETSAVPTAELGREAMADRATSDAAHKEPA